MTRAAHRAGIVARPAGTRSAAGPTRGAGAALLAACLLAAAAAGCGAPAPAPGPMPAPPGATGATPALPRNRAPFIDALFVTPTQPVAGQPALLTALVRDEDPATLVTAWTVADGTVEGDGFGAVWATPAAAGAYRVSFSAEDGRGARAEVILYVAVSGPPPPPDPGNTPPVIDGVTALPDFIGAGETTVLSAMASDPDGDPLSFLWLGPPGDLVVNGADATYVAFDGECLPGWYAFSLLADDGRGGFAESQVSVWIDPNP